MKIFDISVFKSMFFIRTYFGFKVTIFFGNPQTIYRKNAEKGIIDDIFCVFHKLHLNLKSLAQHCVIKENLVFQIETMSLMLCLHAFACVPAHRQKPPYTPSALVGQQPENRKTDTCVTALQCYS